MVGDSFNLGGRHQHAGAHVHGANLAGLYQSANRKNRYSQEVGDAERTLSQRPEDCEAFLSSLSP